jgi:hypothetical protein
LVVAQFLSALVHALMEEVARRWARWVHVLVLATGRVSLAPFLFVKPTATYVEPVTKVFALVMQDGKGFIVIYLSV